MLLSVQAAKNKILGPLKKDMGIVTFFPPMVTGLVGVILGDSLGTRTSGSIFCMLPFLNFLLPTMKQLKVPFSALKAKWAGRGKPARFVAIFKWYCISSTVFWLAAIAVVAATG